MKKVKIAKSDIIKDGVTKPGQQSDNEDFNPEELPEDAEELEV